MKVPVLVPKIFNFPFTYDSGSVQNLKIGDLVIVPSGKSSEIGVIWDKIQPSLKEFKIKQIEKRIDNFKINKSLVDFINWFSTYNLVSKGMVLKMCLGDKKNVSKIENQEKYDLTKSSSEFNLNNEQKKSLEDLRNFGNKFNVSLLQGVTGSGKTIVYFNRAKEILEQDKQVLIFYQKFF